MGVYSKSNMLNESVEDMNVSTGGHIMDAVIESVTNDLNMFNAVITLDFCEAYADLGMDVFAEADGQLALPDKSAEASESAKQGILKRIIEFLGKIKDKLISTVKSIVTKLLDVFKSNQKILEKYEKDFDNNAKSKKVNAPEVVAIESVSADINKELNSIMSDGNAAITKLNNAEPADYNGIVEEFKKKIKENKYSKDTKNYFIGEAKEHTLSSTEIAEIKKTLKDKKYAKNVYGLDGTAIIKSIQTCLVECKGKMKESRKAKDKNATALFNAMYKIISAEYNAVVQINFGGLRGATAYASNCRKVFLTVARGSAEEATGESAAMDYMIGVASDIYMESVFAA